MCAARGGLLRRPAHGPEEQAASQAVSRSLPHCWIFFITDPRNAGREDLGCPFGCAEIHCRKSSNKRSAEYNASAVGKRKRFQREEERKLAEERSAADALSPGGLLRRPSRGAQDASPPSVEEVPPGTRRIFPRPPGTSPARVRFHGHHRGGHRARAGRALYRGPGA